MGWPFILALSITHIIAVVLVIFVYPFRKSGQVREGNQAWGLNILIIISVAALVLFAAKIGFAYVDRTGLIYWLLLYCDGLCFGLPFWIIVASFIGIRYIKKKHISKMIDSSIDICVEAVGAVVVAAIYAIIQHLTGMGEIIFITLSEAAYIALIIAVIVRMCQGYPVYLPGGKVVCKVKNSDKTKQPNLQDSTQFETSAESLNDPRPVQQDLVQSDTDSFSLDDESPLQQYFTQPEISADSLDDHAEMCTVVVCFQTKLIQIVEKIIICVDGESVTEVTDGQPIQLIFTSNKKHQIEAVPFRFYSKSKAVDIPQGKNTIYYLVAANADLSVSIIKIDGPGSLSGMSEYKSEC